MSKVLEVLQRPENHEQKLDTFFYGKEKENHQFGTGLFVHHRRISAFKRVEFVSDRISYIALRGRWFNIIDPNVHAPSEEKSDD